MQTLSRAAVRRGGRRAEGPRPQPSRRAVLAEALAALCALEPSPVEPAEPAPFSDLDWIDDEEDARTLLIAHPGVWIALEEGLSKPSNSAAFLYEEQDDKPEGLDPLGAYRARKPTLWRAQPRRKWREPAPRLSQADFRASSAGSRSPPTASSQSLAHFGASLAHSGTLWHSQLGRSAPY